MEQFYVVQQEKIQLTDDQISYLIEAESIFLMNGSQRNHSLTIFHEAIVQKGCMIEIKGE
jgi:hypothetical protein